MCDGWNHPQVHVFWWFKIVVNILKWCQCWTVVESIFYLMWWIVMVGGMFSTTFRKCTAILMISSLIAKTIWTMFRSTTIRCKTTQSLPAVSSVELQVTLFVITHSLVRCNLFWHWSMHMYMQHSYICENGNCKYFNQFDKTEFRQVIHH